MIFRYTLYILFMSTYLWGLDDSLDAGAGLAARAHLAYEALSAQKKDSWKIIMPLAVEHKGKKSPLMGEKISTFLLHLHTWGDTLCPYQLTEDFLSQENVVEELVCFISAPFGQRQYLFDPLKKIESFIQGKGDWAQIRMVLFNFIAPLGQALVMSNVFHRGLYDIFEQHMKLADLIEKKDCQEQENEVAQQTINQCATLVERMSMLHERSARVALRLVSRFLDPDEISYLLLYDKASRFVRPGGKGRDKLPSVGEVKGLFDQLSPLFSALDSCWITHLSEDEFSLCRIFLCEGWPEQVDDLEAPIPEMGEIDQFLMDLFELKRAESQRVSCEEGAIIPHITQTGVELLHEQENFEMLKELFPKSEHVDGVLSPTEDEALVSCFDALNMEVAQEEKNLFLAWAFAHDRKPSAPHTRDTLYKQKFFDRAMRFFPPSALYPSGLGVFKLLGLEEGKMDKRFFKLALRAMASAYWIQNLGEVPSEKSGLRNELKKKIFAILKEKDLEKFWLPCLEYVQERRQIQEAVRRTCQKSVSSQAKQKALLESAVTEDAVAQGEEGKQGQNIFQDWHRVTYIQRLTVDEAKRRKSTDKEVKFTPDIHKEMSPVGRLEVVNSMKRRLEGKGIDVYLRPGWEPYSLHTLSAYEKKLSDLKKVLQDRVSHLSDPEEIRLREVLSYAAVFDAFEASHEERNRIKKMSKNLEALKTRIERSFSMNLYDERYSWPSLLVPQIAKSEKNIADPAKKNALTEKEGGLRLVSWKDERVEKNQAELENLLSCLKESLSALDWWSISLDTKTEIFHQLKRHEPTLTVEILEQRISSLEDLILFLSNTRMSFWDRFLFARGKIVIPFFDFNGQDRIEEEKLRREAQDNARKTRVKTLLNKLKK